MIHCAIAWEGDFDLSEVYSFNSQKEADAFRKGVSVGMGAYGGGSCMVVWSHLRLEDSDYFGDCELDDDDLKTIQQYNEWQAQLVKE